MKHNLHFLLTDDDEDDRFLFQEALFAVDSSISCQTAKSGKDALLLLNEAKRRLPDIIFLDINMPDLNGWEFLATIKKNSAFSAIPIVMYSTSSYNMDIERAKELGAFGFCTKPEAMNELEGILNFFAEGLKQGFHSEFRNSKYSNLKLFAS